MLISFLKRVEQYYRISVISSCMLYFIVYAMYNIFLVILSKYVVKLSVPELPITSALNAAIAFLLIFRTDTAYKKFLAGRDAWSSLTASCKNMARIIYAHGNDSDEHRAEKIQAMREIMMFLFSAMRLLRENEEMTQVDGEYYKRGLYQSIFDRFTSNKATRKEQGAADGGDQIVKIGTAEIKDPFELNGATIPDDPNYPLQRLSRFLWTSKVVPPTLANSLEVGQLSRISRELSECAKVQRTPVPYAYTYHLDHVIWMYMAQLPLDMLERFGWSTFIITGVVLYLFMGLYQISVEIENPFGNAENDLRLEKYIRDVEVELYRLGKAENVDLLGGGDGALKQG